MATNFLNIMEIKKQIIIKFTSDYLPLINHAHHYISFYNHIYSDHIKGTAYFEIIANGIVAIYKSYEKFIALISPKTKNYEITTEMSPNIIFNSIIKKNFPVEGISIKAECIISDNVDIISSVVE